MKAHDNDGDGSGQAGAAPCTLSVVVPTRNEAMNVRPSGSPAPGGSLPDSGRLGADIR